MNSDQHNVVWEHRQQELWDRIFQVTEDVVLLADDLEDSAGADVIRSEMIKSAMSVGKFLVRATAAEARSDFEQFVIESKMQAIETDYWLRLAYIVQQNEAVQRDLSSVITQYSTIVDLLDRMLRHVEEAHDVKRHTKRSKVRL